jgi:hypothetical protein
MAGLADIADRGRHDAPGIPFRGLGEERAGSHFEAVEAAFIGVHVGIMRPVGIGQVVGMFAVPRVPLPATLTAWPKPVCGRLTAEKSKDPADDAIAWDDGSELPPKKPLAPSARERFPKAKLRKLK